MSDPIRLGYILPQDQDEDIRAWLDRLRQAEHDEKERRGR